MINGFSKHFFWLFTIIGFFLTVILLANEYFSHQIFLEEYSNQEIICEDSRMLCDENDLAIIDELKLNANQLKLIQLKSLIIDYEGNISKIFTIFLIFVFIGVMPGVINISERLYLKIKLFK